MNSVAKYVRAMVITLKQGEPVVMNSNPEILACANGVVDLRTGKLRHPCREDYITVNTGVAYRHGVDDKWWRDTVLQICGGNPRLAEFIQVWCGYCATGYTREHCMAIFHGGGRNGKNLIMDGITYALGDYAKVVPQGLLEHVNGDSVDNNTIFALAAMHGLRLACSSETTEGAKLRESSVKSQTGDQFITARRSHQDFFTFKVTHKLVLATNHRPTISGTDEGIWSRIRMVPMKMYFAEQELVDAGIADSVIDKTLLDRVGNTEARESILRWLVEGASKYLANGLTRYTPPEITAETKGYRREQDVLGTFLQSISDHVPRAEVDRITAMERDDVRAFNKLPHADQLRVEKRDMYRTYEVWCKQNGHRPLSATAFARRIVGTQRYWQDDIGEELLMRPLDAVRQIPKQGHLQFYRYIKLSDFGVKLRNIGRSMQQSGQPSGDTGDGDF